jgi:hypothetical protein
MEPRISLITPGVRDLERAVFTDPDGHPWEVAHNPRWTIREDGSVELPA